MLPARLTKPLLRRCRAIGAVGADIQPLATPVDFHRELIRLARGANRRIRLASLYLGDDALSRELVGAVTERLAAVPALRVTLTVDASRAERDAAWHREIARRWAPFDGRATVQRFSLPRPRSRVDRVLAARGGRAAELVGVFHAKAYVFDDTTVLSGANLSDTYFSTRQDRALVFRENAGVAGWYSSFLDAVARSPNHGAVAAGLRELAAPDEADGCGGDAAADTLVFPTVGAAPFGVSQDSEAVLDVVRACAEGDELDVATGYFNLTRELERALLGCGADRLRLVAASPEANGWNDATGAMAAIPRLYARAVDAFRRRVARRPPAARPAVDVVEYSRDGWSFHAKGVWLLPHLTVVGSANFGERSAARDIEAQAVVVTRCPVLARRLGEERDELLRRSAPPPGGRSYGVLAHVLSALGVRRFM